MKRNLLTLTLIVLTYSTLGQNKKTSVGLLTFQAVNIDNHMATEALTEKVKEVFVRSKRFVPLDRSLYAELAKLSELETQKRIEYVNGEVARQGRLKGAKNLVGGKLLSLRYDDVKKGTLKRCIISFSITIQEVETGQLLEAENFEVKMPMPPIPKPSITEEEAFTNALIAFENKIKNFIIGYVPFFAPIQEIKEHKRGAEVLIVAGENEGIEKGDQFAIYRVTEITISSGETKTRKEKLATFSIANVEGDFSTGIVGNKEAETLLKVYSTDTKIVCQSIKKGILP